MSNWC